MQPRFSDRARDYLEDTAAILERVPVDSLDRIFGIIRDAYLKDRQVVIMGNGGSAALASHFAVDLGKGTVAPGLRRFRVTSIVDNTPVMTAYANDFSYADVFSEQIRTLVRRDDLVVGISTSGTSPNVIKGLEAAREAGAVTVAMTGFKGGKAIDIADVTLVIPSDDVQHIEDCHHLLCHLYMQAMRDFVLQAAVPQGSSAASTSAGGP